jgi:hypothetical protein
MGDIVPVIRSWRQSEQYGARKSRGVRNSYGGSRSWVVSLNARDEVLSAEFHKIRGSQRTQVPRLSGGYRKEDDQLKAVCIAPLVAC